MPRDHRIETVSREDIAAALNNQEIDMGGGFFPIGENNFWHHGIHLKGARKRKGGVDFIDAVHPIWNGTLAAYRLSADYAKLENDLPEVLTFNAYEEANSVISKLNDEDWGSVPIPYSPNKEGNASIYRFNRMIKLDERQKRYWLEALSRTLSIDFFMLKHEIANPRDAANKIKFYTLYLHLYPDGLAFPRSLTKYVNGKASIPTVLPTETPFYRQWDFKIETVPDSDKEFYFTPYDPNQAKKIPDAKIWTGDTVIVHAEKDIEYNKDFRYCDYLVPGGNGIRPIAVYSQYLSPLPDTIIATLNRGALELTPMTVPYTEKKHAFPVYSKRGNSLQKTCDFLDKGEFNIDLSKRISKSTHPNIAFPSNNAKYYDLPLYKLDTLVRTLKMYGYVDPDDLAKAETGSDGRTYREVLRDTPIYQFNKAHLGTVRVAKIIPIDPQADPNTYSSPSPDMDWFTNQLDKNEADHMLSILNAYETETLPGPTSPYGNLARKRGWRKGKPKSGSIQKTIDFLVDHFPSGYRAQAPKLFTLAGYLYRGENVVAYGPDGSTDFTLVTEKPFRDPSTQKETKDPIHLPLLAIRTSVYGQALYVSDELLTFPGESKKITLPNFSPYANPPYPLSRFDGIVLKQGNENSFGVSTGNEIVIENARELFENEELAKAQASYRTPQGTVVSGTIRKINLANLSWKHSLKALPTNNGELRLQPDGKIHAISDNERIGVTKNDSLGSHSPSLTEHPICHVELFAQKDELGFFKTNEENPIRVYHPGGERLWLATKSEPRTTPITLPAAFILQDITPKVLTNVFPNAKQMKFYKYPALVQFTNADVIGETMQIKPLACTVKVLDSSSRSVKIIPSEDFISWEERRENPPMYIGKVWVTIPEDDPFPTEITALCPRTFWVRAASLSGMENKNASTYLLNEEATFIIYDNVPEEYAFTSINDELTGYRMVSTMFNQPISDTEFDGKVYKDINDPESGAIYRLLPLKDGVTYGITNDDYNTMETENVADWTAHFKKFSTQDLKNASYLKYGQLDAAQFLREKLSYAWARGSTLPDGNLGSLLGSDANAYDLLARAVVQGTTEWTQKSHDSYKKSLFGDVLPKDSTEALKSALIYPADGPITVDPEDAWNFHPAMFSHQLRRMGLDEWNPYALATFEFKKDNNDLEWHNLEDITVRVVDNPGFAPVMYNNQKTKYSAGGLYFPECSSPFNMKRYKIKPPNTRHTGIDLAPGGNTEVKSFIWGTVWAWIPAGNESPFGNMMIIKSATEDKVYFLAHLKENRKHPNERVMPGETVAITGNTGQSGSYDYVTHLHLEIWLCDKNDKAMLLGNGAISGIKKDWTKEYDKIGGPPIVNPFDHKEYLKR